MDELIPQALRAVAAVADRLGLKAVDAVVIHSGMNEIVHLAPHPIVARVMGETARVRDGSRLAESLDVAHYMARRGVPITPLATLVDPGPHESDGVYMTLWEHLEMAGGGLGDPSDAGQALKALHEAGADCPVPVSGHTPTTEIRKLAASQPRPTEADRMIELLDAIAVPDLPKVWLHGDAHLGNFLQTTTGSFWGDWEEAWFGPVAWDLACLAQRRDVFGEVVTETDAALAAYGPFDAEAVAAYMPLVALWIAAWGMAVAPSERSRHRLDWVAQRV